MDICFYCDVMLGKLAKWLRILGYDTVYGTSSDPEIIIPVLLRSDTRYFITCRRKDIERFPAEKVFQITYRFFDEQLIQTVRRFNLVFKSRIFTRCLQCNTPVTSIDKKNIFSRIPPMAREHYSHYYYCSECDKIYWDGTHYRNSVQKLRTLFPDNEIEIPVPDA